MASRLANGRWRAKIYLSGGGEGGRRFSGLSGRRWRGRFTTVVADRNPKSRWLAGWRGWVQTFCWAAVAVHSGDLSISIARRIIPELGHRALSAITAAHIEAAQRSWNSSNVSSTVIAER